MTLGCAFIMRLEQYLKERNMTVYRFVKESGVSRSALTNLAVGKSKSPTLRIIYQTARGLGITPVEFLDCELFKMSELEFD